MERLGALVESTERGLRVGAISGPGGVGKSYLLDHVLASVDLGKLAYLRISANGENPQYRGDFFGLIEGQLAPTTLPLPAVPERDYFPATRRAAVEHRRLLDEAGRELQESGAPEPIKKAALALLRSAHFLNRSLPKSKGFLDVAALNLDAAVVTEGLDAAWELTRKLKALSSGNLIPAAVRDLFGDTLRNRIRGDLFNAVGDALVSDLINALEPATPSARPRRGRPPIEGAKRLLLVLDDYEALAPVFGDFLVTALVPRLAAAHFPTLLLVIGRDDLEDTHVGWAQHARKYLRAQIRLAPFTRPDALDLLSRAGIPEDKHAAIYEATHGFPFLLDLAIDEAASESTGSALFLRRFFERTSRWMSRREQEWFTKICYLDKVNEDTLAKVFPQEDVRPIQDWFEREASIRDPAADCFRVRPLIREKVLRYLEIRSPSRHKELLAKAVEEAK